MSFWEKMTRFTRPYSEEEYDDDNYEEENNGYEEAEEESTARPRRTSPFDTDAEPAGDTYRSSNTGNTSGSTGATGFNGRVVNTAGSKYEVFLYHAKSFADVPKIADELREKKGIIVNMENVDKSIVRRIVDFLSGCAYVMDGKAKKVAQSTYFFCTHNTTVSGDLENIPNENENYF